MNDHFTIQKNSSLSGTIGSLPSSKSLSNRALLINALMGGASKLENLSSARDTQLMKELLHTPDEVIDVKDAGTVMRFLTAYFAVTGQSKTITGTPRMLERPIGHLVDALRSLGTTIEYGGKEGYPPLVFGGFDRQRRTSISIRSDISSQFISALMMIGPTMPKGITIELEGKVGSRPYLTMTADLMSIFGVRPEMGPAVIKVPPGSYQPGTYRVEPDWSAISYWYAFVALSQEADILLPNVTTKSLQGDRVIEAIMKKLGVISVFGQEGLRLTGPGPRVSHLQVDFSDCPDLAQTVLPVCAGLGVSGEFTGMESLRIKETDRIAALTAELIKLGARLEENGGTWKLAPGNAREIPRVIEVRTYHDHRMAMGLAPWATQTQLKIEDPGVVGKSYPGFWEDMKQLGFSVQ